MIHLHPHSVVWRNVPVAKFGGLKIGRLHISLWNPLLWSSPRRVPLIVRRYQNALAFVAPGLSVYWRT